MAAVAVAALTTLSGSSPARAQEAARGEHGHSQDTIAFTVDVAENFALFVPTKVKPEDSQPERGAFFVTEGNIYPAGTIQGDGASFDPRSEGALGRWFCRGTHFVSGSEFPTTAQAVFAAQLYLLPNDKKSIYASGGVNLRVTFILKKAAR